MSSVKFLGKYYLQDKIATSAGSQLFRAMEIGPNGFERMVGVHRLLDEIVRDDVRRLSISNSVEQLSALVHPSLVRPLDFTNIREDWIAVREWVHGTSLRVLVSRLNQHKHLLTPEESLYVARELLLGLEAVELFAESRNISLYHGNIQPNTVMLSFEGEVKLLGLGLSDLYKIRESGPVDTSSLPYRAPEDLAGKPLDTRADIFAVGTLLYELLTGTPMWLGKNNDETTSRIQAGSTMHQCVANGVPRELGLFICKAVEPRRDWRYLGAAEASEALAAAAPRLQPQECQRRLASKLSTLFSADVERERVKIIEEHKTLAKLLGAEPPPMDQIYARTSSAKPVEEAAASPAKSRAAEIIGTQDIPVHSSMPVPGTVTTDSSLQTGHALESLVFDEDLPVSGIGVNRKPGPEPELDEDSLNYLVRSSEVSRPPDEPPKSTPPRPAVTRNNGREALFKTSHAAETLAHLFDHDERPAPMGSKWEGPPPATNHPEPSREANLDALGIMGAAELAMPPSSPPPTPKKESGMAEGVDTSFEMPALSDLIIPKSKQASSVTGFSASLGDRPGGKGKLGERAPAKSGSSDRSGAKKDTLTLQRQDPTRAVLRKGFEPAGAGRAGASGGPSRALIIFVLLMFVALAVAAWYFS